MAIDSMKQTNAKNLVFFHYDPGYDDKKLDSIKEFYSSKYQNTLLSYEDLEIDIA